MSAGFFKAMSSLAEACMRAFSSGCSTSDGQASLRRQFPGCCLLRWLFNLSLVLLSRLLSLHFIKALQYPPNT